jgi:hypothetical protein
MQELQSGQGCGRIGQTRPGGHGPVFRAVPPRECGWVSACGARTSRPSERALPAGPRSAAPRRGMQSQFSSACFSFLSACTTIGHRTNPFCPGAACDWVFRGKRDSERGRVNARSLLQREARLTRYRFAVRAGMGYLLQTSMDLLLSEYAAIPATKSMIYPPGYKRKLF